MRIRLSAAARRDLSGIWTYSAKRWDDAQADRYVRLIADSFDGLAKGIAIGRGAEDVRPGYLKLAVGSHFIFFRRAAADVIEIRRDVIEGEFEAMLRSAEPQPQMFALATAMLKELWKRRQTNVASQTKVLKATLAKVEAQVDQVIERIVETTIPTAARMLEEKVQRLESEKLLLLEKNRECGHAAGRFRPALTFLASPCNL